MRWDGVDEWRFESVDKTEGEHKNEPQKKVRVIGLANFSIQQIMCILIIPLSVALVAFE